MKTRKKYFSLLCLLLISALIFSGCAGGKTPYQVNDDDAFHVSVKYDANGGTFTTNVTVIVDSFNISELAPNENGEAEIALLAPDDTTRGSGNAFTPVYNDHFFLGWYAERTPSTDGDGYVYSKKWDFEADRLCVPADGSYSAAEPVMTLYAVWAPLLTVEFYDLNTEELIGSYSYDPTLGEVAVPSWDTDKGTIDMERFPKKQNSTFNGAYYDKDGTQPVTTDYLVHTASIDYDTGKVNNPSMKLYVDWLEGEWYHIYTAEQFRKNASLSGNYVLHADLDFTDEVWPTTFMHGNFTGSIQGNGYTIRNISAVQTQNSKSYAGLFGNVTESARFSDVTFDNVAYTIQAGTRVVGTCFGLFAGNIHEAASIENVSISNSVLQIDSGIYYTADSDYLIGLVCAMGNSAAIASSDITCVATGSAPETVHLTVNGNDVSVEIVSE